MNGKKLPNDATASSKGTVYQFYVVLKKCFEMTSGQSILIEKYGDVTVDKSQQIEVKNYQDPLTDNHINFWKTLRNWMDNRFDDTDYVTLVLMTTQTMGAQTNLKNWNSLDGQTRMSVLTEIYRKAETQYQSNLKSLKNASQRIPRSLELQRYVFMSQKQQKLKRVVAKLVLAVNSPGMETLYEEIRDIHCKGILRGKRDDYLNSLLGYVIYPETIIDANWEVTYDAFASKVCELTAQYCHETRQFPNKFLGKDASLDAAKEQIHKDHLFVRKIHDIEYPEVVTEAIQHYLNTTHTVEEEFRDFMVPPQKYDAYQKEVLAAFRPMYRTAARNALDIKMDSQNFYDKVISEESPDFSGFERPRREFRNGVLHIHMDDDSKDLKWRLS